jgi:demethylmenaquinone methyltransferase/2-methoxy-6-polyprenyl-1,4-benzoquinol methylase
MGSTLSFGQDPRWRRYLVGRIEAPQGAQILDVASGTGLVARALAARGYRVTSLDASEAMLSYGAPAGPRVVARGESLPFADAAFDALTFTYLLRYVDDPGATLAELARVVKPGGSIASLEFNVPPALWARAAWHSYTSWVMPVLGSIVSPAWTRTAKFLGPSIAGFWRAHPLREQLAWWDAAGIGEVGTRERSNGAAIVIWGARR